MAKLPAIRLTEKVRDMALIHTFSETLAVKFLLTSLYAKIYTMPQDEAVEIARRVTSDALDNVFAILSKYSDLDVPGLRQELGL